MRYKIILSNTKETITIREEELKKVLQGITSGNPVMVLEGIFNPSYYVAIVEDKDRMRSLAESERMNSKLREPSPFAKLLESKLGMFPENK